MTLSNSLLLLGLLLYIYFNLLGISPNRILGLSYQDLTEKNNPYNMSKENQVQINKVIFREITKDGPVHDCVYVWVCVYIRGEMMGFTYHPMMVQWLGLLALQTDTLVSNSGFATELLCDLEQVTQPLEASVSASMKWGQYQHRYNSEGDIVGSVPNHCNKANIAISIILQ